MIKEMDKVNKNSPLPLYYQLKELLKRAIENGGLKPGEKIPSERELCNYHEISRMTVHKAVDQLVQEEYLYREQGKGTFVAPRKKPRAISPLASFTDEMEAQGLASLSLIKEWETIEADKSLSSKLGIKEGDSVYRLLRLRFIEQTPFLLEETYLPISLCPGLKKEELEDKSLYRLLREKYHYRLERAEATVEPLLLTGRVAEYLESDTGTMGLFFQQTTFIEGGRLIEYTEAHYRSDNYKFKLRFGERI